MAIETIHEAVLTRLLNNSEPLTFTLRTRNKRNDERLSKGYWFTGNDSYLNFSLWDGSDWRNKTSNIFFGINVDGKCWLEVVDSDNTDKARFFEEIAPIIGLEPINNKDRFQWRKSYKPDNNYLACLDEFLKKDKKIIDAFILTQGKKDLFQAIPKDNFQNNLENVLEWREKIYGKHEDIQTNDEDTKYPIRLKKVMFDNIGHFRHLEINLDQQVTCLIGENGTGKTSILRGIALGLAGIGEKSDNSIIDPTADPIKRMLRIQKIEGTKEVYASTGQIKVVYNEKNEKNIINFEDKKDEVYDKTENRVKSEYVEIRDNPESDLTATRNNNEFVNLVLGFSQIKSISNVSNDVKEHKTGRISEVASLIYKLPDDSSDNFAKWIVQLSGKDYDKKERAIRWKVLTQTFEVIEQIVGGQFDIMPMEDDQTQIFIRTSDAPEGITLDLISQGYNNVIGWVGYFMQRLWQVTPEEEKINFKQTPAVCLIDEIDTYLHPKWEQTILSVLAENFPNTQFVVTTHSPVVVANLKDNYKIYTIEKHKDLMLAFEHNNAQFKPYGAESSRVLRLLMQFQERPDEVQKVIAAYNEAILENDFVKAEHIESKLKNLIDPNDPVLVEGEASIEARKMLQEL